ncbi:hypothetical protein QT196_33135 [Streptomyces sp. P9-2B-2]|nr:hypothetical protein [Streptomyces sp. P9-2B-2]WJY41712.1 hypothetical protein QT196_33135 [Streptomyces sp. P9-2B-2]
MATTCVSDATAESNRAMREFMAARTGRPLFAEEQDAYERLLAAWAAASATAHTCQASTISFARPRQRRHRKCASNALTACKKSSSRQCVISVGALWESEDSAKFASQS